jgi:succinate dehydrogenase / fumarate reductase iron-sulfur subunit
MVLKKITLRILRYKPGHIDPPRYQEFAIEADPDMTVLDGLEKIRLEQDASLMYRHSCHHSSCGTCACKINGTERLTCTTRIEDLKTKPITLLPLDGFKPLADLVVDMSPLYDSLSENWSNLKISEKAQSLKLPQGIKQFSRFENCIECGACVSACPVTQKNTGFAGPAVLAALNNELKKSPQKSEGLLSIAGNEKGERLCERALNCSRVCPTLVYPAKHISELHKLIQETNWD